MITMLLGGLWHGASWRFIIWGALHGAALAFHKMYREWQDEYGSIPVGKIAIWFNVFLTFHFVCFCWIFFRAPSMNAAGEMMIQILTNFNASILFEFMAGYKGVMFLMLLGYVLHFLPRHLELRFQEKITDLPFAYKAAWMLFIIILVIQTKSAGIQPFIYFQF
jgi:D-alanyl-lipoteichoic acid acyltransferase DltB (MBOAT superfamily)